MNYRSTSRIVFEYCNYAIFTIFCISILLPFLNAISISLSGYDPVAEGIVKLWPKDFNFGSYAVLTSNDTFVRSFINTVCLTIINTAQVIIFSVCAGYALTRPDLVGKKVFFYYILITMFFSGGLIPTYLLVNSLGIANTYLALILPSFASVFYIIVFKNVIDQLPKDLMDAAEMDGAGEFSILFRVILPMVLPMTAAFTIFSAVGYWNEWFNVLLYIRDSSMWTLQYQLRDILVNHNLTFDPDQATLVRSFEPIHPANIKMAALMITILPIIIVYPLVQKYFIHGQLVGAVKG